MPEHNLIAIEPDKNEQGISITWQVSDVCNFRCSYCNEGNWGGKRPNSDTDHLIKSVKATFPDTTTEISLAGTVQCVQ